MLTVENLVMGYGGAPVLGGVDLTVGAGQIVSLVGPSGSGKSSLLRAVMGLETPISGRIALSVGRGDMGVLFQDDALLPWRSAPTTWRWACGRDPGRATGGARRRKPG